MGDDSTLWPVQESNILDDIRAAAEMIEADAKRPPEPLPRPPWLVKAMADRKADLR